MVNLTRVANTVQTFTTGEKGFMVTLGMHMLLSVSRTHTAVRWIFLTSIATDFALKKCKNLQPPHRQIMAGSVALAAICPVAVFIFKRQATLANVVIPLAVAATLVAAHLYRSSTRTTADVTLGS